MSRFSRFYDRLKIRSCFPITYSSEIKLFTLHTIYITVDTIYVDVFKRKRFASLYISQINITFLFLRVVYWRRQSSILLIRADGPKLKATWIIARKLLSNRSFSSYPESWLHEWILNLYITCTKLVWNLLSPDGCQITTNRRHLGVCKTKPKCTKIPI